MGNQNRKYVTYSFETKKKAIEMRLQGMTKQRVAEELGISDIGRFGTVPVTTRILSKGSIAVKDRLFPFVGTRCKTICNLTAFPFSFHSH